VNKKKLLLIPAVFIAVVLIILAVGAGMLGFFKSVPKPEVKEGEFDFALTYEVDGEVKKIEGTYVCKFEGIDRQLDGVARKWTGYIKDHDNFTTYDIKTTDEGDIKVDLDISAQFFMSDPFYKISANTDDPKPEPYVYITSGDPAIEDPANEVSFGIYEGDDVKIISFEYDPPVQNTYK